MKLTDRHTTFALNGNSIKDQSVSKISLMNTGVTVSQTQAKNFKNALYFNGSSFLTLDSTNLIPTTGDWTIDWWEWRDSSQTSGGAVFHQNYGSRTGYGFLLGYMNSNNNLAYAGNNGAWNIFSGISCGAMKYGEWCHYAFVRSGSTFYTFQNGVQIATATSSASMMTSTQKIQIGIYDYSTSTYFKGYIDSLRVSNVARWTATFTPPEYENELKIKTDDGWKDAQKYLAKTDDNTWSTPKSVYTKVSENLIVLDYIESTGTQWIDTGVKPASDIDVEIDFQLNMTNGWACVFGGRDNSSNSNAVALWLNDTSTFSFYRNGVYSTFPSNVSVSARHYFKCMDNTAIIDGNTVSVTDSTFTGTNSIYLFAVNDAGTTYRFSKCKIYSCKIYDNGTLIRDYIPVLDSSGVACLYDKVTSQLFYNQGTGIFTAGYKTEFEPETELVFLESTGTQYVDTVVTATQNTGYEIDFSTDSPLTTDSSWGAVMGAITSGTNRFGFDTYPSYTGGALYYGSLIYDPEIVVGKRMTISLMDGVLTTPSATTTLSTSTFDTGASIALFARKWNTGTIDGYSKTKIYACKIYNNGILVRDYIPKTDINGTPALFDKVSGTYYYNAGTGMFGAVEKSNIIQREYWKQVA